MKLKIIFFCLSSTIGIMAFAQAGNTDQTKNNNPVFGGWYADPEGIIFGDGYWIYPTFSDDYKKPDRSEIISEKQRELQKNTTT